MNYKVLCLLLCCISVTYGYNILVALPFASKSLHGLFSSISTAMAEAGHDVTYMTSYKMSKQHPNIDVAVFSQINDLTDIFPMFELRSNANIQPYMNELFLNITHAIWKDKKALDIWEKRNDFDVVLMMSTWTNMLLPFMIDSKMPLVYVCTPGIEPMSLIKDGNWISPAVIPSLIMNYNDDMNFWERVLNLPASIYSFHLFNSNSQGVLDATKQYFPKFEDPENYMDRLALTLLNGNFALDSPYPLLPNQIEIGTLNAKKSGPLPKDLEDFFSSSGDDGVIYFSLGSIAKSTDIPQMAKIMFVEAFRRLPQKVLWKYEGTDLDLPPNVITKSWLPQQDILGHQKTRLFISHCGNLGTQEAKYHGVPVLAVPIAFDQPRNAIRMAKRGYGLVLQWEDLTTEAIINAVNTIIQDKSYKEKIQAVSRVLQDQKDTPAERVVWWLEYVVRHNGAPHMQYAGKRLSLFQYIMLDVIFFWLTIVSVIIFIFVYSVKALCCRSKTDRKKIVKKKQH